MNTSGIFSVVIEFDQSHLFFPRIIEWLLLIMFLLIMVYQGIPYLREVRSGTRSLPFVSGPLDLVRFFGTLMLTILYFVMMQVVGDLFPNTGMGFLLTSIPYMFLLSLLYLHQRDRRHLLYVTATSILAPVIVWFILARLFYITLP
ncbi:tripartite tricarboxylate transporter TctB family protein [Gynuella sunshinyii]|uniref:DUF1468 domain-containing protein n=1 Tax=Gynuella sunshinyii YC6258 TaxID=1445510 RepID=A0A0C5VH03_9GAMM|nr:tripartite tricarboxylate transporter TctB family protein [Gynuella sunshinyii]AJQ93897.1 hypothetical Protein YC6258_01853 [Gynuella sunshinyii YC6258]